MSRVITVANQKGGVGKTTTVISLAHGLAYKGHRVLAVDVDPQGNLAPALGLEQEPGVFDLLVARQSLGNVSREARPNLRIVPGNKRTATAQTVLNAENATIDVLADALKNHGADFLLLDTAPSVGGLQEAALWMADLVVIPSACDFLSLAGVVDLVKTLRALERRHGWKGGALIVPTFYDQVTRESATNLQELRDAFADLVADPIHRAVHLRECTAMGETIFEFAPKSRASEEYSRLIWKVLDESKA